MLPECAKRLFYIYCFPYSRNSDGKIRQYITVNRPWPLQYYNHNNTNLLQLSQ